MLDDSSFMDYNILSIIIIRRNMPIVNQNCYISYKLQKYEF